MKKQLLESIDRRLNTKACQRSMDYLAKHHSFIKRYASLDRFVFRAFQDDRNKAMAMEHHLSTIRACLIRELWACEIYLGVGTVDQLLYEVLLVEQECPVARFVDIILENGVHQPGFVVYPLHSFGLLGLGIYSFFQERDVQLDLSAAGIAVSPQGNSAKSTRVLLENTRKAFGIEQDVPMALLDHFRKSRDLRWLDKNPLLAVKVSAFSGDYYENQFIFVLKLQLAAALLMMMAAMGRELNEDEKFSFSSSSRINNFQTLDLHHYLVFQASVGKKRELEAKCVPMNANRLELLELSDLGADLDPRVWLDASKQPLMQQLHTALRTLERGFLNYCVLAVKKDTLSARVYRKLRNSINYFRRSFRAQGQVSEGIVALAIAIETLLTDAYARGVTERIVKRVGLCLVANPDSAIYMEAVDTLYKNRGAIVHHGDSSEPLSLWKARQAYVLCFVAVIQRLGSLPPQSSNPIGDILRDSGNI